MKPTSDNAFSDSLDEFISENATKLISANYWTLCEIKSHVDPETWEEDPDHLESVINNYELFTNKKELIDWLKERIELYEGMGYLDQFLSIGITEECDYANAESFFKALDLNYLVDVLKICWATACSNNNKE